MPMDLDSLQNKGYKNTLDFLWGILRGFVVMLVLCKHRAIFMFDKQE